MTALRRAPDLAEIGRPFARKLVRAAIAGVWLLLAGFLADAAFGASLGEILQARGYTRTLFVAQPNAPGSFACTWGRCLTGEFNPAISGFVNPAARYGVDQSSAIVKGNTVGERLGDLSCAVKALGLPASYAVTGDDISDARILTRPGQMQAAWDAELSGYHCDDPTPQPTGCLAPKQCIVPPAPCETCEVCPTCPTPCAKMTAEQLRIGRKIAAKSQGSLWGAGFKAQVVAFAAAEVKRAEACQ